MWELFYPHEHENRRIKNKWVVTDWNTISETVQIKGFILVNTKYS